MIHTIIFDIDGVLVNADGIVRIKKYEKLFKMGMEIAKSKEYGGTKWMFEKLKEIYDKGYDIDSKYYKLVENETPRILEDLSSRFKLYACSMATKGVSLKKLKATNIDKYFIGVFENPVPIKGEGVAMVDDRIKDLEGFYYIHYAHGQYKDQKGRADMVIHNLNELRNL